MDKVYTCLAYGMTEPSGMIEAPIARSDESIIERCVSENGKYAKTVFRTLKQKRMLVAVKYNSVRVELIKLECIFNISVTL